MRTDRALGAAPALLLMLLGVLVLAGLPWPCAFSSLTGFPCPTCGMTRAVRFALRGDFRDAFRMHPLWVLVAPTCLGVGLGEVAVYWRTGRWGRVVDLGCVRWGLGAIAMMLVVVWIARFGGAFGGPVAPPVRR